MPYTGSCLKGEVPLCPCCRIGEQAVCRCPCLCPYNHLIVLDTQNAEMGEYCSLIPQSSINSIPKTLSSKASAGQTDSSTFSVIGCFS